MKLELYAIKDELSEFGIPEPYMDQPTAKRAFRLRVKQNQMMADNPQDYSIWKIGEFDTKEGKLTEMPFPELIERAKQEV